MPKGVKASATGKAIAMLERELEKVAKKLTKFDQLRRDQESVKRALSALKNVPFQGVDGGGINHVTVGRKSA